MLHDEDKLGRTARPRTKVLEETTKSARTGRGDRKQTLSSLARVDRTWARAPNHENSVGRLLAAAGIFWAASW